MDQFVFVSHASPDKEVALRLVAFLEGADITCWLASRDIAESQTFEAAVAEALGRSAALVVVYTKEATYSSDVNNQIPSALRLGKVVIPCLSEPVGDESSAFRTVQDVLGRVLDKGQPAIAALASSVEQPTPVGRPVIDSPLERLRASNPGAATLVESSLSQGSKLMAIKIYREATGLGLRESKDAIDRICAVNRELGFVPPGRIGCLSGIAVLTLLSLAAGYLLRVVEC